VVGQDTKAVLAYLRKMPIDLAHKNVI
jgi:hypothetical protein